MVMERQSGKIFIGYEYIERIDMTETQFGAWKYTCIEFDGGPVYNDRKRGGPLSRMYITNEDCLKVCTITCAMLKGGYEKGGGSGFSCA